MIVVMQNRGNGGPIFEARRFCRGGRLFVPTNARYVYNIFFEKEFLFPLFSKKKTV